MLIALLATAAFLAYSNGANDNFKGVATLFGSGACDYKKALSWACWTTLAGSLAALWLAGDLAQKFSGKGLLPDAIVQSPTFLMAVGLGAATTVLLASRLGLPVSTTHALTGALLGSGLIHGARAISLSKLMSVFVAPLLFSPLLAIFTAAALYLVFRAVRLKLAVDKETCICAGPVIIETVSLPAAGERLFRPLAVWRAALGSAEQCRQQYVGRFLGISVPQLLDSAHYLSAGAVSFARGVNDTPKIAALLIVGGLAPGARFGLVALFMAMGGWIFARRVAETMSHKITPLNPGQGFSANLSTALLVIVASRLGLPVSTTHVSVGSLFGIGMLSGSTNPRVIRSIVLSWVGTLPLAAGLAALLSWVFKLWLR